MRAYGFKQLGQWHDGRQQGFGFDGYFISDLTRISNNTWAELKEKATEQDYMIKSNFVKLLSETEKKLLRKLIEA